MNFSDIRIGTKLDITLFDLKGTPVHPSLVSQFEAAHKDGSIAILAPLKEAMLYPIHPNDTMEIIFGQNNGLYGFRALSLTRYREEEIRFLYIQPTTDIGTVQRRGFFRFTNILPCKFRLISELETKKPENSQFFTTFTRDISGGGTRLLFEDKPSMGMNIEGKIILEDEIQFTGKIVRISQLGEEAAYAYEGGISFLDINNKDREKLIAYIYNAQRNLLKKGWTIT